MKFRISSKSLYSCVAAVGRIINAKNTLLILNNFRIELKDNLLTVTASDGESFLEGRLEVTESEGEGAFCVDARRLTDLLKELPEVGLTVEIKPEEGYAIQLSYTNGEFNFSGFSGDDFPVPVLGSEDDVMLSFTAPSETLMRGIDHTAFAMGSDELRPQMMGILWDIKPDRLVFVATDTRKLVRFVDYSIKCEREERFILPAKSTTVFKNVFTKAEDVRVTLDDRGVRFESPSFAFNSRFLKGAFPDYDRVIPRDNPYLLTIDRQAFQSSVRRIGAFCDAANGLVRMRFESDKVTLKASEASSNALAWESTPCDFNGEPMVMGFSSNFVIEILSTIPSPEVLIKLGDRSRPGVFVPSENAEDTELTMILMPMMVQEF